jgi:transcriptional regulator with XRE-family HTH domain
MRERIKERAAQINDHGGAENRTPTLGIGASVEPNAPIGHRIRQLRKARGMLTNELGVSRPWLQKIEVEYQNPSLGCLEKLCERLDIGLHWFCVPEREFDRLLMFEDDFIREIASLLKRLSGEQRNLILKTLEAAPVSEPTKHRTYKT